MVIKASIFPEWSAFPLPNRRNLSLTLPLRRHPDSARMVCVRSIQDGLFRRLFDPRLVRPLLVWPCCKLTSGHSFRGTPKGKGGHDEVARRIASNGQCWVEKSKPHAFAERKPLTNTCGSFSMEKRRSTELHVPAVPRVCTSDEPG